ncbi:MAG: hypothetical protein HYR75_04080 [Gemmatimonadetes bacterium]|nr:hypothetical protein [Gemmatimonadota bacterium]MBI3504692.1 hypothetical protein [Pseudomonadota bacterium]
MRRSVAIVAAVAVAATVTWLLWPRPAAVIVVEPGGVAWVEGMGGSRIALPETLHVAARGRNTTLRLINRDSVRHELALFGANPGETREFTVTFPGTYSGVCTTHKKTGRLVYVVE